MEAGQKPGDHSLTNILGKYKSHIGLPSDTHQALQYGICVTFCCIQAQYKDLSRRSMAERQALACHCYHANIVVCQLVETFGSTRDDWMG